MGQNILVESVMRSPPVTALFSDTVSTIAEKMTSNNIGAIIIMSGGAPAGMVTEKDIVEKIVRPYKDQTKTRAQDIMSYPLISIEADKSLRDALGIMKDKKIRRLAVTRQGKLVGIITERRLLDSLI